MVLSLKNEISRNQISYVTCTLDHTLYSINYMITIQSLLTNLVKIQGFTSGLTTIKVTTQLNENSRYVYIM